MRKTLVILLAFLIMFTSNTPSFGHTMAFKKSPQFKRATASSQNAATGYGFLVPLPGGRPGQSMETFKRDVDGLVAARQTWLRTGLPNWLLAPSGSGSRVNFDEHQVRLLNEALGYAKSRGLKVYVYAGSPDWMQELSYPQYKTATTLYWSGLAARTSNIDVWQLFNEADTSHYKTYEGLVPSKAYLAEMRDIIGAGRTAIRAERPQALITTNLSGWPMDDNTEREWNRVLDTIAPSLDVIALDIYTGDNLTEATNLTGRVDRIEARYRKAVIIAEFGLQTQGWTEPDQALYMPAMIRSLKKARPMAIIAYEYRDTSAGESFQGFGIVRYDRSSKAAASTVFSLMADQS